VIKGEIVEEIAKLVGIELNKNERKKMMEELGKIISYMNKIKEISPKSPTHHLPFGKLILRKDTPKKTLSREEILLNTPKMERGYFYVPKVLKE
jgi:aspartyl-tRNA(Asn)/glutamyl-tRNA(Gln) amidotransferase subunit C